MTEIEHPRIIFVSADGMLRQQISAHIMPHFQKEEAEMHDGSGHTDRKERCKLLHRQLQQPSVLVVGFTGVCPDDQDAIQLAGILHRPCGLIVRTENKVKLQELAFVHRQRLFRFVIAACSVRENQLRDMFPRTPYLCNISDFEAPGKQVAAFIRRWRCRR